MPFYFHSSRNPDYKFFLFNYCVTQAIKFNHFAQLEIFSRYNSLKVVISIQLKPFSNASVVWLSAAHHWDQSRILNLSSSRTSGLKKQFLTFFKQSLEMDPLATESKWSGNCTQVTAGPLHWHLQWHLYGESVLLAPDKDVISERESFLDKN